MSILNAISNAFKGKKAPNSGKIAELLSQAESETATARQRLAELEAQRPEMSLADEVDRRRFRAELAETRDFVEGGEDAIAALRAKHATAMEAEAEDGRKSVYKAAKAKADELSGLIDEYAKAAQAVHDIVAKITEIDAVVRAANQDLPAETARIGDSGVLRSVPAITREIVSEKVLDLWLRPGSSDPLPDEYQKTVSQQPDGTGHFPRTGGGASRVSRGRFTRREYRAAETAVHAVSFGEIKLPDARVAKPKAERPVLVEHLPLKDAA